MKWVLLVKNRKNEGEKRSPFSVLGLGLGFIIGWVLFARPEIAKAFPYQGSEIMISSPSLYATEAGVQVAEKGGNVIDVAVAVALSIAVTNPYYASLGGGGFALIKKDSVVTALDFRETAPLATNENFFRNGKPKDSLFGGRSVGVPGIPAGLWELHNKYGKLPWGTLFREPFRLAQKGFRVTADWIENARIIKGDFNKAGLETFFKNHGEAEYLSGELFVQTSLGRALEELRDRGVKGFYAGAVAKDIVDSVVSMGGVLSLEDLANYKVRWLKPLESDFKGFKVYSMPPPSSAGVVIQTALALASRVQVEKEAFMSVNETHLLGEILSRAFQAREQLGDPDFAMNPIDKILGRQNLDHLAQLIRINKAGVSNSKTKKSSGHKTMRKGRVEPHPSEVHESSETTHFSVVDAKGNSVVMTVTLNGHFGSGVVSDKYGIALNNVMDDFTTQPNQPNQWGLIQGPANAIAPGKRPLSSMSPTIIEKDGETYLALGAPGGPRIISSIFQVIYRVLVNKFNVDLAVQTPRIHNQYWPRKLFYEENRWAPETLMGLRKRGHELEVMPNVGKVFAIRRDLDPKTHKMVLESSVDPRGEGAVGGY